MKERLYGLCKICGCYYNIKTGRKVAVASDNDIKGAVPGVCFECESIRASSREYREDGNIARTMAVFLGFAGFACLTVIVLLVLFAAIMRAI